jgi:hypothetical protein
MLNASRTEVTHLKDILPATYGIIFLGTPHRGSGTATIARIAQDITRALWKNPSASVLHDLEVNAQTLDRVGRSFSQILVSQRIQIYSFREERPTNGVMVGLSSQFSLLQTYLLTTLPGRQQLFFGHRTWARDC